MSFVVLEHCGMDSPHDLLFVATSREQADRVAEALNGGNRFEPFFVEEVADLAPDAVAVRFRGKEVRLDYWRPPTGLPAPSSP